jgi:hypothetical protein
MTNPNVDLKAKIARVVQGSSKHVRWCAAHLRGNVEDESVVLVQILLREVGDFLNVEQTGDV